MNEVSSQESRRILIISHSFAPFQNPRAFRWSAIAEHWAQKGWSVDVITSWKPGLGRKIVLNGVNIFRVGGALIEALRQRLARQSSPVLATNSSDLQYRDTSYELRKQTTVLKWLHDHTWKKVYWPDYAGTWFFPASGRAHGLLRTHPYDAVISVSDPFTGHLVGLDLKLSVPDITWLVDIGDPFCFRDGTPNNNDRLYRGLNRTMEGKVFRHANAVSVTTESTLKRYAEVFPESGSKLHVVLPLMSAIPSAEHDSLIFQSDGKLKLVYIGTLYRAIRNPQFLLGLFARLLDAGFSDKIQLHFFGALGDCADLFAPYRNLLGTTIFLHGPVSHDVVAQAMGEAGVLVNIGNDTPYQLPSKIVEYVCFGKPILNLAGIRDDSSAQFLSQYPLALNLSDSGPDPDHTQVQTVINFMMTSRKQAETPTLKEWCSQFRVESIAAAYERILRTNCHESSLARVLRD